MSKEPFFLLLVVHCPNSIPGGHNLTFRQAMNTGIFAASSNTWICMPIKIMQALRYNSLVLLYYRLCAHTHTSTTPWVKTYPMKYWSSWLFQSPVKRAVCKRPVKREYPLKQYWGVNSSTPLVTSKLHAAVCACVHTAYSLYLPRTLDQVAWPISFIGWKYSAQRTGQPGT